MLFQALDCLLEVSASLSEQSSLSSNYSLVYKDDGRYPAGQFDYVSTVSFLLDFVQPIIWLD